MLRVLQLENPISCPHRGKKKVAIPAIEYLHTCDIPNTDAPEDAFYILSGGVKWEEAIKSIQLTYWGQRLERYSAMSSFNSGDIVEVVGDNGHHVAYWLCATHGWIQAILLTDGHFHAQSDEVILM